jgi:hypothetical protein
MKMEANAIIKRWKSLAIRLYIYAICHAALERIKREGLSRLCCKEGYTNIIRCCYQLDQ